MTTDKVKTPVGGLVLGKGDIEINAGYPVTALKVRNTGDRPIQVGSHFHFFEVNASLEFDREQAFGKRLNIPATTALRFEPGDEKEVSLVPFQGKQRRSEEHTSELQSRENLVCRLLLEKKKKKIESNEQRMRTVN